MKKIIQWILVRLLILTILAKILGEFGAYFWFFDLFSHWQSQYTAVSMVCAVGILMLRGWIWALIALVSMIWSGIPLWQNWYTAPAQDADIYFINALYTNRDTSPYQSYIDDKRPKIIAIVELPGDLKKSILSSGYKEVMSLDNKYDSLGIFVVPELFDKIQSQKLYNDFPYPIGQIKIADIHIVVIHPFPAFFDNGKIHQEKCFQTVSDIIEHYDQLGEKFIVLGDFNSSIFSPVFQSYFGNYYHPLNYSWNRGKIWALPIDQVISNFHVKTTVQERVTSDHSGIIVDL